MLQLHVKNADIFRISQLLVRYRIKASITDEVITIEGEISDELATKLSEMISIRSISNFVMENPIYLFEDDIVIVKDDSVDDERTGFSKNDLGKIVKINDSFSSSYKQYIKRGEIYWCDLNPVAGSEQGGIRPCVVIQNNSGNNNGNTTIVLAMTSQTKRKSPTHYFGFLVDDLIAAPLTDLSYRKGNVYLGEQIRTIDKGRIGKYIGTLKPQVMKHIDEILENSLDLNKGKAKEKIVYVEKTVEKPVEKVVYVEKKAKEENRPNSSNALLEHKDLNMTQIQILALADINKLLEISQKNEMYQVVVDEYLSAFGFDLKKNGVQYLKQAIILSPKTGYFNLETLALGISRRNNVDVEEVKRLIIARVKETLRFKKAPTIDFIRLANAFIKQEEENDETDI